jgi:hypothetical protein
MEGRGKKKKEELEEEEEGNIRAWKQVNKTELKIFHVVIGTYNWLEANKSEAH